MSKKGQKNLYLMASWMQKRLTWEKLFLLLFGESEKMHSIYKWSKKNESKETPKKLSFRLENVNVILVMNNVNVRFRNKCYRLFDIKYKWLSNTYNVFKRKRSVKYNVTIHMIHFTSSGCFIYINVWKI